MKIFLNTKKNYGTDVIKSVEMPSENIYINPSAVIVLPKYGDFLTLWELEASVGLQS